MRNITEEAEGILYANTPLNEILDRLNNHNENSSREEVPALLYQAVWNGIPIDELKRIWSVVQARGYEFISRCEEVIGSFSIRASLDFNLRSKLFLSTLTLDDPFFSFRIARAVFQNDEIPKGFTHALLENTSAYQSTKPDCAKSPFELEIEFDFFQMFFEHVGIHNAEKIELSVYANMCKFIDKSKGYLWGGSQVYNEKSRECFHRNYPHLLFQKSEIRIPYALGSLNESDFMFQSDVRNMLENLNQQTEVNEGSTRVERLTLVCDELDSTNFSLAIVAAKNKFINLQSLTLFASQGRGGNCFQVIPAHFSEVIALIEDPDSTLCELNFSNIQFTEKELIALEKLIHLRDGELKIDFNPAPEDTEAYNRLVEAQAGYAEVNREECITVFLKDLKQYRNGLLLYKTDELADRHAARATQFSLKLKEERVETREELGNLIRGQLDLWLNKNTYLDNFDPEEVSEETTDFYADKSPKKHAQNLYRKDYGNYFHLLTDFDPDLKLDFFIQLYTAQMKGEIKLELSDVEALRSYHQVPEQAKRFEEVFQAQLIENEQMRIAFQENKRFAAEKLVPFLLGNLIAPTGLFAVNPQTATEQKLESLRHHLPYVLLGATVALTLAVKGGYATLFVALMGSVNKAEHWIHLVDEAIHAIKATIHSVEMADHAHIPKLWPITKWVCRVEADTQEQINYFNASVSDSLKDPAEMFKFSNYVLDHLSSALPLAQLPNVTDIYHTHIHEIKALTTFILCVSCLSLGYLPHENSTVQTDDQFLNKLMFVVAYLGPSAQEIAEHLNGQQSTLRRGLINAYYEKNNGETVTIQWRWSAGMRMAVKPHNRQDAVNLVFGNEVDNVTHDAMPFELALLKSLLTLENQESPIALSQLPGVKFTETNIPEIRNETGGVINNNEQAVTELIAYGDRLKGMQGYTEYKTTQVRLFSVESAVAQHEGALAEHAELLGAQGEQLEQHNVELSSPQGAMAEQADKIGQIEGAVGEQAELQRAQGEQLEQHEFALRNPQGALAEQASEIGQIEGAVGEQSELQRVQGEQLSQHNAVLAEQVTKIDGLEGAMGVVVRHETALFAPEGAMAEQEKNNGKLKNKLDELAEQTEKLEAANATLDNQLNALTHYVLNQEHRLSALEKENQALKQAQSTPMQNKAKVVGGKSTSAQNNSAYCGFSPGFLQNTSRPKDKSEKEVDTKKSESMPKPKQNNG